jgi:sec-independent protein translocase protein TatA
VGLENPLHIAILLVILLLLFGAKRLPEMGRGLGSGIRSFKDGLTGHADEIESEPDQPAASATPALPAPQAAVAAATSQSPEPSGTADPAADPAPVEHAV